MNAITAARTSRSPTPTPTGGSTTATETDWLPSDDDAAVAAAVAPIRQSLTRAQETEDYIQSMLDKFEREERNQTSEFEEASVDTEETTTATATVTATTTTAPAASEA